MNLGWLLVTISMLAWVSAAAAAEVRSAHARVSCDPESGRVEMFAADGKAVFRDGLAAVTVAKDTIACSDARFKRAARVDRDAVILECTDDKGEVDLTSRATLNPDRAAALVELSITNRSARDLILPSAQVLRGRVDEAAGRVTKALTNGYIYYDSGKLRDFSPSGGEKAIDSFWDAAFYSPEPRGALFAGFVENDFAEGHILGRRDPSQADGFELTIRADFHPTFVLKPGQTIRTGRVLIEASTDPFAPLEHYGDVCAEIHHVKLNPVINGWCSWFVYYGGVSEAEVLKNAEFIAKELKPYGMDWIQIDDGFYRAFGDWEGNDRFPQGMKHAADEIKKLGLKPGLWIAPYCIGEKTEIATKHPDWLVHEPDGSLQKIEPAHQMQAQYILDITNPQAKQWLSDLLKTITQDWGYRFIKTDFVEWTLLAAHQFHDCTMTTAQAYRMGDQVMRDAMGKDAHFLDCGPGNEVVGLIDSMRIGLDRPDDLPNFKLWGQYALEYNATIPSVAKRYYFGGKTWINDPDHLRTKNLTIPQAQAASTIIAMSGGTTISGDKLYELDRERIEIIKKVLPSYGHASRPLDLFENPQAEQFALPIRTSWDNWTLVANFNPLGKPVSRKMSFAAAGLDASKEYLVYDFWAEKLLGEFKGEYPVEIEPTAVQLVAIREKTGRPQVISTDRHVTQGAIELENVNFDEAASALSGTALGAAPMAWTLSIYVPAGYRLDESAPAVNLADIKLDASVLRARVKFDGPATKVQWSLKFVKS